MAETFDFIVVGGGAAGCLLAAKLASTQSRPSVLLVEAGAEPVGDTLWSPYDRYTPVFTRPDLDHGYLTVAQSQLNGRVMPYARGKGLGGIYLYGSADDYERWADLVGDDSWRWANTSESLKQIEHFHASHTGSYAKYANPDPQAHGTQGFVDVSLPTKLERGLDLLIDAAADYGYPRNLDMNSGNPIGAGLLPSSFGNGRRTTSATAHLAEKQENLTIWTNLSVARLLFKGKKAIGVEGVSGLRVFSNNEVILCAGAFDSPKIMLLSGIGASGELASHGIATLHDLPGVGKNLQDHPVALLSQEVDPLLSEIHEFESDADGLLHARQEWLTSGTGPLTHHNASVFGAFLKLPHLEEFAEFKALDPSTRTYLLKPAVPHYEIAHGSFLVPPGSYPVPKESSYTTPLAILMNPQSRGSVSLRSADPKDAPLIDPNYLDHPFDRKVMLELVRETMKFQQESAVSKYLKYSIIGPKSTSDEDILEFIKEVTSPLWHANGTVKMGAPSDPTACVDSKFRVYGIESLRVADMSVAPLTVNNHPQSTAYLIGHKAAEAIIEQWGL